MVTTPAFLSANNGSDPPQWGLAVTPSDSVDLTGTPRGLYIGGTGNVTVLFQGGTSGDEVQFAAVPAGSMLPGRFKRVMLTGTSATSIVAIY